MTELSRDTSVLFGYSRACSMHLHHTICTSGHILIQRDEEDELKRPKLFYAKFPPGLQDKQVMQKLSLNATRYDAPRSSIATCWSILEILLGDLVRPNARNRWQCLYGDQPVVERRGKRRKCYSCFRSGTLETTCLLHYRISCDSYAMTTSELGCNFYILTRQGCPEGVARLTKTYPKVCIPSCAFPMTIDLRACICPCSSGASDSWCDGPGSQHTNVHRPRFGRLWRSVLCNRTLKKKKKVFCDAGNGF